MAFLLDTLKEKLKDGDEDEETGFKDLKYKIGNTSGMDIGQVPGPLDQRIGRMAQIGGSIMEIQITNPATFQIDRPELMGVISQLGFEDVTLHGDPNIGFTGAYATRGQGVTGYNIVHRYFKRYLEQMASFREVMRQDKDVNLGYVNMHASNEQIPPREEQIASDKSLDPFGMRLTEINGDKRPNIYRNEEFMRLLFDFLFKDQIERVEPYELYSEVFVNYSDEFKEKWNKARKEMTNKKYDESWSLPVKSQLLSVLSTRIPAINTAFQQFIEDYDQQIAEDLANSRRFGGIGQLPDVSRLDAIAEEYDVDRTEFNEFADNIWEGSETDLPYEIKATALLRAREDITRRELEQPATDITVDGKEADEWAKKAFSENIKLFEAVLDSTALQRQMEKESTAFFNIMPAWMMTASESADNHPGWNVPEFIWENIVVENSDFSKEELQDYERFQDFLDDKRENQLNVIAAVGACYLWGHFTQREDSFETKAFEQTVRDSSYEEPDFGGEEEVDMTWVKWMNRFGLRVNIEAMFGSPGELRRLWRPRDIAVACHAINMQARQDMGEDYDENLVKFTIDMEHTASYGVDPLQELNELIQNERRMAEEEDLGIDAEKPLAEIVKTYHLTKPGWEQQQGHRHGPFARGDETLYTWLYRLVENGFARNQKDEARIIFEVGGEYREEMFVTRVAMDMIELGISPDELDPNAVDPNGNYDDREEALMARFFGMDQGSVDREWAKIEEHAFDPLDGLLEARGFDDTFSGQGAIEQGNARPTEWKNEEYQ